MAKFHYIDPEEVSKDPFESSTEKSEFESLLELDTTVVTTRRFKMGESITGSVLRVGTDFLFVDLGGKVAGAIALDEFRSSDTALIPSVGAEVTLFVREDNGSEVILTRSLRGSEATDVLLRNAYDQQSPVDAKVEKTIKGGFQALIGAKRAFIPMSNMDLGNIDDPEKYIGKVFKFLIVTFAQGGRNIVLSRKSLLREEREQEVREVLNGLEVGQMRAGTITRLATFGAFADIGGVEALIPISELSWTRIKKVEDVITVGEKVNVKITKIEHSPRLKIGLTLKGAGEDPWLSVATRLVPGTVVPGKITRLTDFGAFVSVSDGVEGLVHISHLTWEKRVGHPREVVSEGQDVSVHVLNIDLENKKLSLSLKGEMPADLAKRLDAKKRGQQVLTGEEQEQVKEWEVYQKVRTEQTAAKDSANLLANAFAKARTRKS